MQRQALSTQDEARDQGMQAGEFVLEVTYVVFICMLLYIGRLIRTVMCIVVCVLTLLVCVCVTDYNIVGS